MSFFLQGSWMVPVSIRFRAMITVSIRFKAIVTVSIRFSSMVSGSIIRSGLWSMGPLATRFRWDIEDGCSINYRVRYSIAIFCQLIWFHLISACIGQIWTTDLPLAYRLFQILLVSQANVVYEFGFITHWFSTKCNFNYMSTKSSLLELMSISVSIRWGNLTLDKGHDDEKSLS